MGGADLGGGTSLSHSSTPTEYKNPKCQTTVLTDEPGSVRNSQKLPVLARGQGLSVPNKWKLAQSPKLRWVFPTHPRPRLGTQMSTQLSDGCRRRYSEMLSSEATRGSGGGSKHSDLSPQRMGGRGVKGCQECDHLPGDRWRHQGICRWVSSAVCLRDGRRTLGTRRSWGLGSFSPSVFSGHLFPCKRASRPHN